MYINTTQPYTTQFMTSKETKTVHYIRKYNNIKKKRRKVNDVNKHTFHKEKLLSKDQPLSVQPPSMQSIPEPLCCKSKSKCKSKERLYSPPPSPPPVTSLHPSTPPTPPYIPPSPGSEEEEYIYDV